MRITKEEVAHVGRLARLRLEEGAVDLYTKQLGEILAYMDTLNSLDTEGVAATSHTISVTIAFREDEVKPSIAVESALKNAPEQEDASFIVPRIIG
jgi:aspartyl-tRNA(Asn)/glutamyl-tRNA(Gln) amidotransferase subunit C